MGGCSYADESGRLASWGREEEQQRVKRNNKEWSLWQGAVESEGFWHPLGRGPSHLCSSRDPPRHSL